MQSSHKFTRQGLGSPYLISDILNVSVYIKGSYLKPLSSAWRRTQNSPNADF